MATFENVWLKLVPDERGLPSDQREYDVSVGTLPGTGLRVVTKEAVVALLRRLLTEDEIDYLLMNLKPGVPNFIGPRMLDGETVLSLGLKPRK